MTPRDLRRAAAILRREARAIKASHMLGSDAWHAGDLEMLDIVRGARRDHDEMLDLAAKLVAHAKALGAGARGME